MASMDVKKNVMGFAIVAFVLLGVLFGMTIMSYIFGNLQQTTSNLFSNVNPLVVNESNAVEGIYAFVTNGSNYTIPPGISPGFEGSFAVVHAINGSGGNESITADGNLTINIDAGVISGNETSNANWSNVLLTYTYTRQSNEEIGARAVSNNSLSAISTYANQSTTQFSTLSIAITLVILLAVFAVFWLFFLGKKGGGKDEGNFS